MFDRVGQCLPHPGEAQAEPRSRGEPVPLGCNDLYGTEDAVIRPAWVFEGDQVMGYVQGRDPQVVQEVLQAVHVGPEAQGTDLYPLAFIAWISTEETG